MLSRVGRNQKTLIYIIWPINPVRLIPPGSYSSISRQKHAGNMAMCSFSHLFIPKEWPQCLSFHVIVMMMIMAGFASGNTKLKTQLFSSHCGAGFRMNFAPPTWVHYAGSRGECLYRCMSQEKCLAANVLANLKDKMVCEMFDYINLKCDTDSTAASYKVKVNKGLSYLKKTML